MRFKDNFIIFTFQLAAEVGERRTAVVLIRTKGKMTLEKMKGKQPLNKKQTMKNEMKEFATIKCINVLKAF